MLQLNHNHQNNQPYTQQSTHQCTQHSTYQGTQQNFIGWQRQECADWFAHKQMPTVLFTKWMYVADLGLLLTFEHQHCVAIEKINTVESGALYSVNANGSINDFK